MRAVLLAIFTAAAIIGALPWSSEASAASRPVCRDLSFPVYFQRGSDEITLSARKAISRQSQRWKGCDVRAVRITGGRDSTGADAGDDSLALRRAGSVAEQVESLGVPKAAISTILAGPGAEVRILRRRVTVSMELTRR